MVNIRRKKGIARECMIVLAPESRILLFLAIFNQFLTGTKIINICQTSLKCAFNP